MSDKKWYLSMTLWGAFVGLVGMVLTAYFGIEFTVEEQASVMAWIAASMDFVALVLVVIGRLKARTTLTA